VTTPDKALVSPNGKTAKASLRDNGLQARLSAVVKTSARKTHGKQGAAAAVLEKDEGNFSRDIDAGRTTLAELSGLGPDFLADLGETLTETFGKLSSPKDRARQQLREARRILDEIDQYLEQVS
jgi:hypothetical protein